MLRCGGQTACSAPVLGSENCGPASVQNRPSASQGQISPFIGHPWLSILVTRSASHVSSSIALRKSSSRQFTLSSLPARPPPSPLPWEAPIPRRPLGTKLVVSSKENGLCCGSSSKRWRIFLQKWRCLCNATPVVSLFFGFGFWRQVVSLYVLAVLKLTL